MYKVKIGTNYKTMNTRELRQLYGNLCNDKMQEFINNGNEWGKWFFRYEDLDKTGMDTIIRILEEENYKVKVVE